MRLISLSLALILGALVIAIAGTTGAAVDSVPVTVDSVLNNVVAVTTAIKDLSAGQVGIWILIAAVIKLLISAMKLPSVTKILNSSKMKNLKPYIAIVLGVLGVVGTNMTMSGKVTLADVLIGIVAGLGSVGIHETSKSILGKNKN